jgi:hypothetical protein
MLSLMAGVLMLTQKAPTAGDLSNGTLLVIGSLSGIFAVATAFLYTFVCDLFSMCTDCGKAPTQNEIPVARIVHEI